MEPKGEIEVYLVIYGDYFNPNELTKLIQINPTASYTKGKKIPFTFNKNLTIKPGTKPRKYIETAWKFSSGCIHDYDSEKACKIVEDKIKDKVPQINAFVKKHNLNILLMVVPYFAKNNTPKISFSVSMIKMLSDLNAYIDLDAYFNF